MAMASGIESQYRVMAIEVARRYMRTLSAEAFLKATRCYAGRVIAVRGQARHVEYIEVRDEG
jgi:hypothetical protein